MDRHDQLEVVSDKPAARGWLITIGIISILLGIAALLFPWWATLGIELVLGVSLLVIGVLEVVRVLVDRPRAGVALSVFFAAVAILAGGLLLMYPMQGVFTLTLVLAIFFLVGGAFKIAAALMVRPAAGWGWMLTSGIISLVLGIIVLAALPESAFWVLGILFGIDLLFFGAAQIAFATAIRDIRRTAPM